MGYRAEWLSHTGRGTRHMEAVLYAYDREINPTVPVRLLDIGVENGGSAEVWRAVLPQGSEVVTLDVDAACEPDLCGDVRDEAWIRQALNRQWFDFVIDDTRTGINAHLWPFLRAGGIFIVEDEDAHMLASGLSATLMGGDDSWLPAEELLRVACYPGAIVIEKRHPRAMPYMEIVVGDEYPVVPVDLMTDAGIKRVVP